VLRRFAAGRLTNDQYEYHYWSIVGEYGSDDASQAVFDQIWFTYSDLSEHVLKPAERRDPRFRRLVARAILFLQSDQNETAAVPVFSRISTVRLGIWLSVLTGVIVLCVQFPLARVVGVLALAAMYARAMLPLRSIGDDEDLLNTEFWDDQFNLHWPFVSTLALNNACKHPRFLAGAQPA
jgi:hypothetical protein